MQSLHNIYSYIYCFIYFNCYKTFCSSVRDIKLSFCVVTQATTTDRKRFYESQQLPSCRITTSINVLE